MGNLVTWLLGLPSSSSHALIGGIAGAALAASGTAAVNGEGLLSDVIIPALLAPILAGGAAIVATVVATVFGTGIGKRLATLHWEVAGRMVTARLLTLPVAGAIAWAAFELSDALGTRSAGSAVLAVPAALGFARLFALAKRDPVTAADV